MEDKAEKKVKTPEEMKKDIETRDQELRALAISMMPEEALKAVEAAKAAGIVPYITQINDDYFVFRSVKRLEWKAMLERQTQILEKLSKEIQDQNMAALTADLKSEEDLVIKMTLWPRIDELSIKAVDAGIVETLAATIKSKSGFGQQIMAIKL